MRKTSGEAVHEARATGAALTGVNTRMEQLAAAIEVRLQAQEATSHVGLKSEVGSRTTATAREVV